VNTRFFHAGRLTANPAFLRTCSAFSIQITTSSWLRTPSKPWSPDTPAADGRAVPDGVCAGSAAASLGPSAWRAAAGMASPSANASNVDDAVGVLLCRTHSLSRPWPIPVISEICSCVTPCVPRTAMIAPRSRRAHASRTSRRAKTRSTTPRTSETSKPTARTPLPWQPANRPIGKPDTART